MLTLRCTARLRRRLGLPDRLETVELTTVLGDWYANLLLWRPRQVVLLVSERSLLPVVVHAKDIDTLVPRFQRAAAEVFEAIGVPGAASARELREMADCAFGATASRRVLGMMNEFAGMADHFIHAEPDSTLFDLALRLADTPCQARTGLGAKRTRSLQGMP